MSTKWIAWLAGGVGLAAVIGGLVWAYKRRQNGQASSNEDGDSPDIVPSAPPRTPGGAKQTLGYEFLGDEALNKEESETLDEILGDGWPPSEETLDQLETGDVIVFGVESRPVGAYKAARELISASVIVVEKTLIRARVTGEIRYAEHFGTNAGHGLRAGMAVDVPRSVVLGAGRPQPAEGYGSKGDPVDTFKASTETGKTYKIHPSTPYDFQLPYRTKELEWYVDPQLATMKHIGEDGLLEQVMFTEGSMRGDVTVRAIDNDPMHGKVLVGRWDFVLDD
ncbi:hypothetical protein G6O69_36890 [Pseudenhygromyxa sp. WMMC2535]|uniref:hypothetical protein n=1 Tax=Pseudenhygromyxa sp. WMMC2535 TaxID=2712867 RepID=UPI001555F97F|nr:hypothetical protein [Pseudenhygromyxa sp. WMMC2535]NVB37231.1 hypothetical protein [Pseudenhygromyxa sp. WMMC2535]NVB43458.1 hypothetical protein [Pseudenhygromyxa sp. WMMC2535]